MIFLPILILTFTLSPTTSLATANFSQLAQLHRWSTSPLNTPHAPSSHLLLPLTESDISSTIRHANAHNLPFLATSGGHGTHAALARFRGGVVMDLSALDGIELLLLGDDDDSTDARQGAAVPGEWKGRETWRCWAAG